MMAFLHYILPSSLQLWRDVIDSLVSHSLWLRSLLGLPEKETIYLNVPEEQGQILCNQPHLCIALLISLNGQAAVPGPVILLWWKLC